MSLNQPRSTRNNADGVASTLTTLKLSEDGTAPRQPQDYAPVKIQAEVKSTARSKYQCSHRDRADGTLNPDVLVGDAHLVNCNVCGAYFPNSGSHCVRALRRHFNQNKLYTSDILRSLYSQCQQKGGSAATNLKITAHYQEVRTLIIDWLVEVCETLKLDTYKSAYHAIGILDRFLTMNYLRSKQDMDQS